MAGQLAPDASRKLAWATFWLNNVGIIVLFPSLVMVLKVGESSPSLVPLVVSEFIVVGGMACFIRSVWSVLLKSKRT